MSPLCDRCKTAPSTIHVSELSAAGSVTEKHLCSGCAALGISADSEFDAAVSPETDAPEKERAASEKCSICGLRFSEYEKHNLLGCPNDYTALPSLIKLIKEFHAATVHVGRTPNHSPAHKAVSSERVALERALRLAIHAEDFEKAAHLRDQIRAAPGKDSST